MSIIRKIKDAGDKASKTVVKEYRKQQQKAADKREQMRLAMEAELARQKNIAAGNFQGIKSTINLQPKEEAFIELPAVRMASVESVIQETVGTSKKKHGITRTVVGGVLLGPVGAVAGAATAGGTSKSTTVQRTVSSMQQIDTGILVFTNMRMIFMGNKNIISLTYPEIVATGFSNMAATIKYAGMMDGEYYVLQGPQAGDAQHYYTGITTAKLLGK